MQKKKILTGSVLAVLLIALTSSSMAQTGELRRLSITPIPQPDEGIPVFRDYPDKAALIIYSSLTSLTFESNMDGIVDQRSDLSRGRYILIIETFTQIIQINAPEFMTSRLRVGVPRLVLEASYEATMCAAILNATRNANNRVFLTLLGGGAFGNRTGWIIDAMQRALKRNEDADLDVAIVSYGASKPDVQRLGNAMQKR